MDVIILNFLNKESIIPLWSLIVSILMLVVGGASLCYVILSYHMKQKNFLMSLISDLNIISGNSDSYKDVIILSMQDERRRDSILFKGNITKEFSNYVKEDIIVKDQETKKVLQSKIKNDKYISRKIHDFGKKYIYEIQKYRDNEKELKTNFFYRVLVPQYLLQDIDYNFYSKNISSKYHFLLGKSTSNLKKKIFKLKRDKDVINFQVNMLNKLLIKKEKLFETYQYYCQLCMMLFELDGDINSTYRELRKLIKQPKKEDVESIIPILKRDLN